MAQTRHDRLVEEYEDALFALLMEEVAQSEGERLEALNEELQNKPEAAVPEKVDKRCLRTINRHFLRERRRTVLWRTGRILRLAAMIMGISALLFTSAFAVSEKVRLTTLDFFINITDTHADFRIIRENEDISQEISSNSDNKYFQYVKIGWIPEGYLFNESKSQYNRYAMFESSQSDFFIIRIIPGAASLSIDTEDADSIEYLSINGNEGLCVVKNQEFEIMLADLTKGLYYEVSGTLGVTVDTAKKIAENIYIF